MRVSVIVKSYQRPFLLAVCLQSIRTYWPRDRFPDYEIIIADDGTQPDLMEEFVARHGDLFDKLVHSEPGQAKWDLARRGLYDQVVPTCGKTWNDAQALARGEVIFLIEDDSYLIRPSNLYACANALLSSEQVMCLIGLKERMLLDIHGIQEKARVEKALLSNETCLIGEDPRSRVTETFALLQHPIWPWSFDGIFYRWDDWAQIGLWPTNVATGPMENFVQVRLKELGWIESRFYGMPPSPFCAFDAQNSVRTDKANYEGRFRHVDRINAAWYDAGFDPSFNDVIMGAFNWDRTHRLGSMRLHYPRELRQINFVTGHELCGELHGAEADARWLSQANAEAQEYGEMPWTEVPEPCRSV